MGFLYKKSRCLEAVEERENFTNLHTYQSLRGRDRKLRQRAASQEREAAESTTLREGSILRKAWGHRGVLSKNGAVSRKKNGKGKEKE